MPGRLHQACLSEARGNQVAEPGSKAWCTQAGWTAGATPHLLKRSASLVLRLGTLLLRHAGQLQRQGRKSPACIKSPARAPAFTGLLIEQTGLRPLHLAASPHLASLLLGGIKGLCGLVAGGSGSVADLRQESGGKGQGWSRIKTRCRFSSGSSTVADVALFCTAPRLRLRNGRGSSLWNGCGRVALRAVHGGKSGRQVAGGMPPRRTHRALARIHELASASFSRGSCCQRGASPCWAHRKARAGGCLAHAAAVTRWCATRPPLVSTPPRTAGSVDHLLRDGLAGLLSHVSELLEGRWRGRPGVSGLCTRRGCKL